MWSHGVSEMGTVILRRWVLLPMPALVGNPKVSWSPLDDGRDTKLGDQPRKETEVPLLRFPPSKAMVAGPTAAIRTPQVRPESAIKTPQVPPNSAIRTPFSLSASLFAAANK